VWRERWKVWWKGLKMGKKRVAWKDGGWDCLKVEWKDGKLASVLVRRWELQWGRRWGQR
jgi:hypothetical protein